MTPSLATAAIVGLGQAGSRFDEEPRPAIWSHTGACLHLRDRIELLAGVDPDPEARRRFEDRVPSARCYPTLDAMLACERPDIVCLAAPPTIRLSAINRVLGTYRPRVIVAEKPLALAESDRSQIVRACEAQGVRLLVHYNRPLQGIYRRMRSELAERLGRLYTLSVLCPNRVWSIGSHAVHLLLYLANRPLLHHQAFALPSLHEDGEQAWDLHCNFADGLVGRVQVCGPKHLLLFEVDAIGEYGRLRARGNGGRLEYTPLISSDEYVGYRVEGPTELLYASDTGESTFVRLWETAYQQLAKEAPAPTDGPHALLSETILDGIAAVQERVA
ncbi:MAG: Gfo/Idh/MocA family oxidoreductase [Myxococcales bacterium]|nr:Gfo/Idh/MocA family oxidoreductase [Myxococcales bacterium]MDD9968294.1 Gfo/Idh/MocA family oxidoreductase [Myxococcales bacterium]